MELPMHKNSLKIMFDNLKTEIFSLRKINFDDNVPRFGLKTIKKEFH